MRRVLAVLALVLLAPVPASAFDAPVLSPPYVAWRNERFCDGTAFDADVVLDSVGQPFVVYGCGRQIHVARRTAGVWFHEFIMPGNYPQAAMDADGRLHVVSWIPAAGMDEVRYAVETETGWNVRLLPIAGYVNAYVKLDVGSDGRPHIVVPSNFNRHLEYFTLDAVGNWLRENITTTAKGGIYSFAVDPAGVPHAAYGIKDYRRPEGSLVYATRQTNGSWDRVLVDIEGGDDISLAFDTTGAPHISYHGSNEELKYTTFQNGAWQLIMIDNRVHARETDIAVDATGTPHITYVTRDPFGSLGLGHARYVTLTSDGRWMIEEVSQGVDATYPTIAVTADGMPSIAYRAWYTEWPGTSTGIYYTEPLVRAPRVVDEL